MNTALRPIPLSIVTGASRGLGLGLARQLLQQAQASQREVDKQAKGALSWRP